MNKYKTLDEVRAEKQRLNARKEILEEEIKLDFEDLKQSVMPVNIIKNAFKSDKGASTDSEGISQNHKSLSPFAVSITGMALDLLVTRLFMKRSSLIKKLITSYLIRTGGPGLVEKAGPVIASRLGGFIDKFLHHRNVKTNGVYDRTTASDVY
jgi:hypothetical protein